MTSVLSSPMSAYPADSAAALHAAVERLFRAADAASVAEICEGMLRGLGVGGRLHWRLLGDTEPPNEQFTQLDLAEDPQGLRSLVLTLPTGTISDPLREILSWIGRLVACRLRQLAETSRLYEAISRLALAERLQRALYAIADQAGAEHNMTEMMHSLHAILGSLMYAENFYIALYDAPTDTVRFPYYVDTMDKEPPSPDEAVALQEMRYSLTWNLLQSGQAIMGSVAELTEQFKGRFVLLGPVCEHWLGVPLLRDGRVVGGIVMQSYREDTHSSSLTPGFSTGQPERSRQQGLHGGFLRDAREIAQPDRHVVVAQLGHHLTAGAAWTDRAGGVADHGDGGEIAGAATGSHGGEQGGALGAVAQAVGGVLHIAAGEMTAVASHQRSADEETGVRRIRAFTRLARQVQQDIGNNDNSHRDLRSGIPTVAQRRFSCRWRAS